MKKLFTAILCAAAFAAVLSGCGYNDALYSNSSSSSSASADSAEPTTTVSAGDYEDSLDGLVSYFADKGYIENSSDKITEMDASAIGASSGKKFSTTYNSGTVTVELYVYDTSALNATADEVIGSVKSDGTFTIYGLSPVTAYLSDSGKYLMIYSDTAIDKENPDTSSDNYKHREQVIEDFKAFKG